MSQATLADALTDLCRRAAPGPDTLPDGDLLRRFAEARDEAAFAALVRRHGRLVWGAALRRTGDYQAAEDIYQATFLALARRAGRLHGRTSLGGWLYTVAVRLARRAARHARPVPVDPVPDFRPGPLDALSARELLAALDDELARLPEPFRLPVVLCCLDGLSRDEAAARLACSFGSLKGRLERGREMLRRRLAARGISLSAVLGGLVLVPAAVPAEVTAAATTAILGGTARPAATALAGSLSMGRAAGLVTVAAVALLGLGLSLFPAGTPPTDPKPPAKESEPAPAKGTIAVKILRDGKPATGVTVWAALPSREEVEKPVEPKPLVTGADGQVRVAVDADAQLRMTLYARDADGRIGEARVWEHDLAMNGPAVVHLVPVGELTGQVRSADGKPIAGVEVKAQQFNRRDEGHEPARPSYLNIPSWLRPEYTAKTGADGRFRIRGAPVGYKAYVPMTTDGFGQGFLSMEAGQSADLTLQAAGTVRIKLAGPGDLKGTQGLGFRIYTTIAKETAAVFIPGASGTFDGTAEVRVPNLAPGRYRVEVRPTAKYPVRVTVQDEVVVSPGATGDLAVTVEPMARTTGRLLDGDSGKGIPKATVYLQVQDGKAQNVPFDGWVETDADGRFVAYGPPGMWVQFSVNSPPAGYAMPPQDDRPAAPQPAKLDAARAYAFPDLKLRRTRTLRGAVVDEAGKPVPAPTVFPGRLNMHQRGPNSLVGKPDGTFALSDLAPADVVAPRVRKGDAVNVPSPVEVARQDGPVAITLSEKNACRVRGRVTDDAGKPLAGARVGVSWHFQGLGAEAPYSTSWSVEAVTTDADGRYTSGALWPKDRYQVTVTHEQFSRAESKQVQGEAGQVHDLGTVKLVATGKVVRGTVVGTDGKPLAGVTVSQKGDGTSATSATSGPDGAFTLGGYFDRPGFVLVRHDGYRPTAVAARPGEDAVTVTLRKATEPPAPAAAVDGHEAALTKFTRSLLEKLWADREQMGGFERNVFTDMARFDPATAKRWRDEEKKRTGGKVDLTRLLDKAELEHNLLAMARDDLDEALTRIPKATRWDVDRVATLARQLLAVDKVKALRAAEEAAVRARGLDPGERPWGLARAGDVAVRAGNPAGGKKLLAEAVELAARLPADKDYYRGWVAAAVVAHDEPAAFGLIDRFADPDRFNEAVAEMVARLAETDPDRAEALFGKLRPGRNSSPSSAHLSLGFRLAATDPTRAEAVVTATPQPMYRILGLARLATLVAPKDRVRAWKLIDQAADAIDRDPQALRGWTGGPPLVAAVVAVRAREVGHPDVAGLVARALAHRTGYAWNSRKELDEQAIHLATVLAFADPAAARALLAGIAPPAEFARRAVGESRDWLFAAALADPEHAGAVVDAIWAAARERRGGGAATSNTGLIELLSILTGPGDRLANMGSFGPIPRIPDAPE